MNKYAILMLALFFSLSFASAQACKPGGFIGTFASGTDVEFIQSCPSCTFINVSVTGPAGTVSKNQPMTLDGGVFNFTVSGNSTRNQNGLFYIQGFSNLNEPFVACFQVNQSGIEFDNLWVNFLIIFLLSAGGFALIFTFNESRQNIFGGESNYVYYYLGSFLFFSIGTYTILFGFGGYKTILTEAVGWIAWGSGLYFLTKPYFIGGKWKW